MQNLLGKVTTLKTGMDLPEATSLEFSVMLMFALALLIISELITVVNRAVMKEVAMVAYSH